MKKEIVSKSFGLVVKEAFMFLVIRIVLLAQSFFETVANQAASNVEIDRMKGEVSYAFANFVINHQNSFTAIFTFISSNRNILWFVRRSNEQTRSKHKQHCHYSKK